ncbi:MAG: carbamoyltransferase N-terminal domain-containing protein [Candidatus Hydrogenedentota bacterium]
MATILGVSCFYHDSAACLVRDGMVIAAADEERFSRRKHDSGFPALAMEFCLRKAGITTHDLDAVVFYEKPFKKFHRILATSLATYPRSYKFFRESMTTWLSDKFWMKSVLHKATGVPESKILFIEHHLSHAASAFLPSPYDEAAVLSVDGVGEWTTTALGHAKTVGGRSTINLTHDIHFPHSLGLLYSAFTAWLGFEVNEGEYKVMGMAPYGRPEFLEKVHKVCRLDDDGFIQLDMSYFSHHYHTEKTYTNKFAELFGKPRERDEPAPPRSLYTNVASSIQKFTEEAILRMAKKVQSDTGCKKLVMAGGVALNSVANYRILKETAFEEIFVQPSAGDSGGAMGAALYADHVLFGNPRKFHLTHAYWGEEYSQGDVEAFLKTTGAKWERIEDDEKLYEKITIALQKGHVVGWMQGRFEWGPRALGNRSILADPRRAEMKEVVNAKIKFREAFRPFAPSVLMESVKDHFEMQDAERHQPSRYMLYVVPITTDAIPAVKHEDGTGRLQAVERAVNPRYYDMIKTHGAATGVPIVLNTSFNLKGEPIVTTPANAFSTFSRCEMDMLVMQNAVVYK